MIYFITAQSHDYPVKIGFTANDDPWIRLADLQTGNPHKLHVFAISDGDQAAERELHSVFANDRLEGEWFTRSDRLMSSVDLLASTDVPPDPRFKPEKMDDASRREAVKEYRRRYNDKQRAARAADPALAEAHREKLRRRFDNPVFAEKHRTSSREEQRRIREVRTADPVAAEKFRQKNLEYQRAWRARNPERVAAYHAAA